MKSIKPFGIWNAYLFISFPPETFLPPLTSWTTEGSTEGNNNFSYCAKDEW